MTTHPVPRKISFTGSVETGKKVALSAAPDLKRVTLELGGNDPAIVLDDADPAAVASAIFAGAFNNNGQVCSAIKRVYVPEALYDDVVEGLAAHARAIKVGEGTEEGVKLGPINNEPQYERVKELVADALSHGATAVTGGKAMDRPGYFFEPTILTGLSDGTRIVDEEQFGPALPVVALPGPGRRHRPGQRHPLRALGLGVERFAHDHRIRVGNRSAPRRSRSPNSWARCASRSSSRTSMAASAAAHATSLPPNVDVCTSGALPNARFQTSGRAMNAPTGTTPPDSPLASVITSGTTSSRLHAKRYPQRPKPVCTSSAMNSAFARAERDSGEQADRDGQQRAAGHREMSIEMQPGCQAPGKTARQPCRDASYPTEHEPEDQVVGERFSGRHGMAGAIAETGENADRQRGC